MKTRLSEKDAQLIAEFLNAEFKIPLAPPAAKVFFWQARNIALDCTSSGLEWGEYSVMHTSPNPRMRIVGEDSATKKATVESIKAFMDVNFAEKYFRKSEPVEYIIKDVELLAKLKDQAVAWLKSGKKSALSGKGLFSAEKKEMKEDKSAKDLDFSQLVAKLVEETSRLYKPEDPSTPNFEDYAKIIAVIGKLRANQEVTAQDREDVVNYYKKCDAHKADPAVMKDLDRMLAFLPKLSPPGGAPI